MTAIQEVTIAPARTAITRAQWLVLGSGFLGWLFDSMDLNLFTLVLFPSVAQLIKSSNPTEVTQIGGYILAIKLFCWGLGGIAFGVADRIGRTRTMVITMIVYALFTGLSGVAQSWQQLAVMQAIAGFGIGGEWSAGAALIAESWPEKHRARAMQVMQMAFAFGFLVAALDNLILGPISWRWVLAAGALPAIIALCIRWFVPESDRWQRARSDEKAAGTTLLQTFTTMFEPVLRRRTIVGVCWLRHVAPLVEPFAHEIPGKHREMMAQVIDFHDAKQRVELVAKRLRPGIAKAKVGGGRGHAVLARFAARSSFRR